jgi:hypothetical protein
LEDISNDRTYSKYIGLRYEVSDKLDAYGIRDHSKAPVRYITLMPPPGIGGLQVAFSNAIRPGTIITISKVCKTNRLFVSDKTLLVSVGDAQLPENTPIRIDLFRGNEGHGKLLLNPKVYRQLP